MHFWLLFDWLIERLNWEKLSKLWLNEGEIDRANQRVCFEMRLSFWILVGCCVSYWILIDGLDVWDWLLLKRWIDIHDLINTNKVKRQVYNVYTMSIKRTNTTTLYKHLGIQFKWQYGVDCMLSKTRYLIDKMKKNHNKNVTNFKKIPLPWYTIIYMRKP